MDSLQCNEKDGIINFVAKSNALTLVYVCIYMGSRKESYTPSCFTSLCGCAVSLYSAWNFEGNKFQCFHGYHNYCSTLINRCKNRKCQYENPFIIFADLNTRVDFLTILLQISLIYFTLSTDISIDQLQPVMCLNDNVIVILECLVSGDFVKLTVKLVEWGILNCNIM